jgi:phosphopantetheine adenylyltransferase
VSDGYKYKMRIGEILNEVDYEPGTAPATNLTGRDPAQRAQYIQSLIKDPNRTPYFNYRESLQSLQSRCNHNLNRVKQACQQMLLAQFSPGKQQDEIVRYMAKIADFNNRIKVKINDSLIAGKTSRIFMWLGEGNIEISNPIWNGAPNEALLWVIAHEYGHLFDGRFGTSSKARGGETYADDLANAICVKLGVTKVPVLKWMKRFWQSEYKKAIAPSNTTTPTGLQNPDYHPTGRQRINRAAEFGIEMSKLSPEDMEQVNQIVQYAQSAEV